MNTNHLSRTKRCFGNSGIDRIEQTVDFHLFVPLFFVDLQQSFDLARGLIKSLFVLGST